MKVRIDDGTEIEGGPGDTPVIPLGHDAWLVGDEPWFIGLYRIGRLRKESRENG